MVHDNGLHDGHHNHTYILTWFDFPYHTHNHGICGIYFLCICYLFCNHYGMILDGGCLPCNQNHNHPYLNDDICHLELENKYFFFAN